MTHTVLVLLWIVAGILLIVAEMLLPNLILIFFGAGAAVTGVLLWAGVPMGFGMQFAAFSTISLLLLIALRRYAQRLFKGLTADVADREPGFEEFIGKEAIVSSGFGVRDENGRVSFRGTDWDARGSSALQIGERVRIVGRKGHFLTVEKV